MTELKRQKVLIGQAVTFILTALVYVGLVGFGGEEIAEYTETITGGVFAILEIVQSLIVRTQLTPVDDPRTKDGLPAELVVKVNV